MRRPLLGLAVGGTLGLLDGLSAWFQPEARPMLAAIVVSSTLKGVLTGVAAGLVARWRRSMLIGVGAGVGVGFVLSTLAALAQPDHYLAIVLPGMLVGALCGFVTQRDTPAQKCANASRPRLVCLLIAGALSAEPLGSSQPADSGSGLAPLEFLIGRWEGTSEGRPGRGTVEREYTRMLGSRFLHLRNRSVYPPQEANPKGEEHEDVGIFSFDRARQRIVLRQFHVEGFVNHYVLDAPATPGRFVFETESIENIASGWRARETCVVRGTDAFEEIFELAAPGQPFEVYSRAQLKRRR